MISDWFPLSFSLPRLPLIAGYQAWLDIGLGLAVALLGALLAHKALRPLMSRLGVPFPVLRTVLRYTGVPTRVTLVLFLWQMVLQAAPDATTGLRLVRHLNTLLLISTLTWLGARLISATAQIVIDRHPLHTTDNLLARRTQTQARVLARTLSVLLTTIGLAAAMMTLPGVRQFGASLLASAGVAGLIVGLAAKPILGNVLAGMQLALTQPIRLDDVVIIEGEWGRIEEITMSYIVIKIWDERRMIVPLQWFIEHPFQNWTRASSNILGTVFLWVDYRIALAPLRAEAERLCQTAPEWDGRLCMIQVTDTSERAMQLRVLVSAADSGRCFDLRCRVREGLIAWLGRESPESLPCLRLATPADAEGAALRRGPLS